MSDVKWIKLSTDIFNDEKIAMVDALPNGDSVLVIWFKLLTLAGRNCNGGIFLFNDKVPYTDEMFAAVFRRDLLLVRESLKALEQVGLIEIVDNIVTIPGWSKNQTLDAYEKKKLRDKEYQRERRKALEEKKSSDNRPTVRRDCSYSYSLNSNINNLEYILSTNSDYKYKDYINNNSILLNSIREWMQYKDEKTAAKKKNHYDTERGLKAAVSEIVNADKKYGTDEVIGAINRSIVHNWDGIYWDKAEERKAKADSEKKPVPQKPQEESVGLWRDEWDNEDTV